jgi:RNA polymerase sigma-70 factor, ECF subfamily
MSTDSRAEFHRLFIENQRRLFGFVLTLLPRVDEAEDVFQNICVVLLGKFDAFQPGTSFIRWACQIAKFEVLNYRRRSRKEHCIFNEQEIELLAERRMGMEPELEDRRQALRQCLEKLRPEDRRLVQVRYAGDCNAKAAAERLHMHENTAYKALQRIRRALRRCIDARLAQERRELGTRSSSE